MKYGIILWMFLVFPLALYAQDTETITLERAIAIALENNYQLKQAENSLALAEYQEFSAKADFLPSLSAGVSGSKRIGRQFNQNTISYDDFTINGFSSNLNASFPIFNGFRNINNLRSSQLTTLSQEESVDRARENIIFETASRFLQVLLNRELLEISRENLQSSRAQLEQIRAQVDVGALPAVDLLNQEAVVANNDLQVTTRENQLSTSRLLLIRSLQIDPLGAYEFAVPGIDTSVIMPVEYNLQDLVNAALENRSDLQSQQLSIEASQYQLKAARGAMLPSLNFSAGISSSYNNQNYMPGGQDLVSFGDQFLDQNINRSFSLSMNIPIFSNFNQRTNVQSQMINYRNQLLSLENTELQVVQEVNQAYSDYQAVIKQLEATETALRAAERSYETEQERYNVGASTLIELTTANTQYVQAQSDRVQALYNYVFQQNLLDYYIGRLDQNISLN